MSFRIGAGPQADLVALRLILKKGIAVDLVMTESVISTCQAVCQ